MKRIVSCVLAMVILFVMLPLPAQVHAAVNPVVSIDNAYGEPGGTVDVYVDLKSNPGITSANLSVNFDENLTLVSAENGEAFSALSYMPPHQLENGDSVSTSCQFAWFSADIADEYIQDGTILKLTFQVSETAEVGKSYSISVFSDDVVDKHLNEHTLSAEARIAVIDYTPGNVNDDAAINMLDVILLCRYIVDGCKYDPDGYGVSIVESAANVNDDNKLSMLDVVLLCRYIVDGCQYDPNGYAIKLLPETPKCSHAMEEIPFKAAKCEEDGNIAYYHCAACGKYFNNNAGTKEIELESTVLKATGHTAVTDPYQAPAYGVSGWTEGSHCSTCDKVLVAQQEIAPLVKDTYYINYVIGENDVYLQGLEKEGKITNNNPTIYEAGDSVTLNSISVPGYIFEGWYDGPGSTASQVKTLSDLTQSVTLYAHWTLMEYKVQFDAPLVPMEAKTFKVNEGLTLSDPAELPGYIFMGWSDEYGNLVTQIPRGTADNVTLYGNWTSQRNHTRPVENLGTPIVHLDEEEGVIVFAYEIGTVENIPLSELKYIGNMMQGVSVSESVTKAVEINSSTAKEVSEAISNATTKTSEMTLSNEWTTSSSISESHMHEMDSSVSSNVEAAYSNKGTYNVSTSSGGSTTTAVEAGVSSKVSSKVATEASVGFPIDVVKVGAKVNTEVSAEVGAELKTSQTDTKTWNTNRGYETSQEASMSSSLSRSMSEKISNSVTYDVSRAATEGMSSTESTATTSEKTREYASTVAYGTAEIEERTYSMTLENAPSGYYRLVCAGRAHVFAVVTYDIANRAYGMYTYSIMEDDVYPFLDFSKESAAFDDNENGVLPFEVPFYVNDYVDSIIGASDGLVIDEETGIIEAYNGTDEIVVVPQYLNVVDGDNINVVKVTGIAPGLFAGKTEVKAVQLCSNITEIPDNAFNGCSSLVIVSAPAVTKIGNSAFVGCTSLKDYTIPATITSLGTNAFAGVTSVTINATKISVVDNGIGCGAKNIVLNMALVSEMLENKSYTIPAGTESFTFNGASKTYNNVVINSDAAKTIINNATFTDSSHTPLTMSSADVVLNKVTVSAPGVAMKLTGDGAAVGLQGKVSIGSAGPHAAITKNVQFYQSNTSSVGSITFDGNLLVSGNEVDESLVNFTKGKVIYIDSANPAVVTFNPNGGTVEETSRLVYGDTEIGELPVPTRDYYTFKGWFTSAEGGEPVVAASLVAVDTTVYAQWEQNATSGWVLASELPEGAEVVNKKWSYTETTTTESKETSLDGYTQVGSYWVQSGSGSQKYSTAFPSGFDKSHSIYTSFAKSAVAAYETETTKREVTNAWTGYVYWHWMYDCGGGGGTQYRAIYNKKGTGPDNNYGYKYFGAFTSSKGDYASDTGYCNSLNIRNYIIPERTKYADCQGSTRWFRFDYYTSTYTDYYKMFKYEKVEEKESDTIVEEFANISNVQAWVQYREK